MGSDFAGILRGQLPIGAMAKCRHKHGRIPTCGDRQIKFCHEVIFLLPVAHMHESRTMKAQRVEERPKIAERRDRAPSGPTLSVAQAAGPASRSARPPGSRPASRRSPPARRDGAPYRGWVRAAHSARARRSGSRQCHRHGQNETGVVVGRKNPYGRAPCAAPRSRRSFTRCARPPGSPASTRNSPPACRPRGHHPAGRRHLS